MKKKMKKFNAIGNVIGVLFLIGIMICVGSAGSYVTNSMYLHEFIMAELIGLMISLCCYGALRLMVEEYISKCRKDRRRHRKAA